MRILVTGITGFAGVHLTKLLLEQPSTQLYGTSRRAEWPKADQNLPHSIDLTACDLANPDEVESLVRTVAPEQVFHLAGYAHAGQSFREPDAAWSANLIGTRNVYDSLLRLGIKCRILYVGSGLIYGDPDSPDQAHDERAELRPASPYATSKAAADLLSYQYARSTGLDIVRVRPFNHIGPGQSTQYAVAHFAEQIARIERGHQPAILETGNLSPRRDLSDVRDVVEAYRLIMERGRRGEAYNVGSGLAHAMQEIVDRLLTLSTVKIQVQPRAELIRTTETTVVRADASRLRRELGWTPRFSLEQSLSDILDYWRTKVR